MIEAGLGSLPGGGAEIFDPAVRARDLPAQGRRRRRGSTSIARPTRSGCGPTPRCSTATSKASRHRIDHLVRLRELQDETGGFQTFVPLAFHPDGTRLAHLKRTSALDDLRTVAVSRLMLDNFDHIKAYWISLGVGTAQVALAYGADDLDGTVRHEEIHHEAGADTPEALSVEEIRRLITEAGREPVERDTLYRPVRRGAEASVLDLLDAADHAAPGEAGAELLADG